MAFPKYVEHMHRAAVSIHIATEALECNFQTQLSRSVESQVKYCVNLSNTSNIVSYFFNVPSAEETITPTLTGHKMTLHKMKSRVHNSVH